MVRANLRTSKEAKPSNLASESVEAIEASVRTQLNLFLVSRVIRPFSVDLSSSDNEALRTRYDDIASKVPQFIASRWRVLASSSTSRPIQLMTPVLSQLTSDATSAILGDLNLNLQLASMMMEPLAPVVRQAYLLGHFIHLEMITADFDVFYGSEIGEPIVISQEENHRKTKHFKRSSLSKQEGRVCGYWSLGLRGKQFVSDGLTQRQTWDVILKPKVLLASSEL
ncbi:hypothetical protein FRC17_001415 [Serendipita sp. 399]|nr:hypothetical protein FRC17_001415 [Serendipita sp. 399]